MKVAIIGYGTVGHNLAKELSKLDPDIIDKYKPKENKIRLEADEKYDLAFICVDTPRKGYIPCHMDEVFKAVYENRSKIFVIKSTVLPGTTEILNKSTEDAEVVFSPEYYGGTQHCNNFEFDFTILGGEKKACMKVAQILQQVYDGRHRFVFTDYRTAELVKYMENAFLATKVSFCHQFFILAKQLGVEYSELRELFVLDPRVNPSHTYVYEDHPFWDSHCLNKDVPAIMHFGDAPLLESVVSFNEWMKSGEWENQVREWRRENYWA